MPDFDDEDEPDWYPPPPTAGPWGDWRRRAGQVLVLTAAAVGFPASLYLVGLTSRRTTIWLLLCGIPALALVWVALAAYILTRFAEKSGEVAERGRMLVIALDLLAAIFTVMGAALWLAILVL